MPLPSVSARFPAQSRQDQLLNDCIDEEILSAGSKDTKRKTAGT